MGLLDDIMKSMRSVVKDGTVLDGDCFGYYDDDHKSKMLTLSDMDVRYIYIIEKKCGIDPYDEDDYNGPNNDIRIINLDHFAIRENLSHLLDQYRNNIQDIIDDIYNRRNIMNIENELRNSVKCVKGINTNNNSNNGIFLDF